MPHCPLKTSQVSPSPKYSSTSAFFRNPSSIASISALEGIFGGSKCSVFRKEIYDAAASACIYVKSESATDDAVLPTLGSVFDRLTFSFGKDISMSPSSSTPLRFVCATARRGCDEGRGRGEEFGRGSFGVGSSAGRPKASRRLE